MTNHPITPPPKLVDQWWNEAKQNAKYDEPIGPLVTTKAAQWGADQKLEACIGWLILNGYGNTAARLRAAMLPKPPSLKEQALAVIENSAICDHLSPQNETILRLALEALPND